MIAKLITYGDSRETALKRMIAALKETVLFGPRTNRDFLIACLEDEAFAAGDFSTAFIAETFGEDGMQQTAPDAADLAVIALRHFLADRHLAESRSLGVPAALRNFTSDPCLKTCYKLEIGDMVHPVQLRAHSANDYTAHINDTQIELASRGDDTMTRLAVLVDGKAVVSKPCQAVTVCMSCWMVAASPAPICWRAGRRLMKVAMARACWRRCMAKLSRYLLRRVRL